MTDEEADEFMREFGEWASWSDCRDMVQAAYEKGRRDARADYAFNMEEPDSWLR